MELAEKHKIHEFLEVEEVGILFKKLAVEILARESSIINLKERDPKVVEEALKMFQDWIGEITGAQNDFLNEVEMDSQRKRIIENSIYN